MRKENSSLQTLVWPEKLCNKYFFLSAKENNFSLKGEMSTLDLYLGVLKRKITAFYRV